MRPRESLRDFLNGRRSYAATLAPGLAATFIAALKGVCAPDPEFAAGVLAQRMVEAAYESARTGAPVTIKT